MFSMTTKHRVSFVLKDVKKIQMDLRYGESVFKGIKDALPGAKISSTKGIYQDREPPKLPIFLVSFTSGEIKNEKISLKTKLGENRNLKTRKLKTETSETREFWAVPLSY